MGEAPLNVITATGGSENPSMSFAIAAGLSVVLVLAIHAPELALAPVLIMLFLFAVNYALAWSGAFKASERRAWALYVVIALLAALGVVAFAPWPEVSTAILVAICLGGTWYLTDKREYLDSLPEVGAIYRELMGRHYPTMSVIEVSALLEDQAKIEIETTAVMPAETIGEAS